MRKKKKPVRKILNSLSNNKKKGVAWLIDPDKFDFSIQTMGKWVQSSSLDIILVGGSHFDQGNFEEIVTEVQKIAGKIPVVIFPGSKLQVSSQADGILFMSLISGKNPEFLISQQIKASKNVYDSNLEVLPTAYLLVNDGEIKSVHRESDTLPIHNQQIDQVISTALAGKFLGMEFCFIDAGSGAKNGVSATVIAQVKSHIQNPLIIGGGLDSLQKVHQAFEHGADMIVVGNPIEKDPKFLSEVLSLKDWYNQSLHVN